MTYFPFDLSALDKLALSDWQGATLAARTAEKLAGYYQDYARAMSIGTPLPPQPDFSPEESAIAQQILGEREHSFRAPASRTGLAAFKLFYATQAEFYIEHPGLIAVFGPNARALPRVMEQLGASLPETWPPVDAYFARTVASLKSFAKHYFSPGPSGPGPAPAP